MNNSLNSNHSNLSTNNDVEILDLDDEDDVYTDNPSITTISSSDVLNEISQQTESKPKMISPEDVFEEVKKPQPKMISPEDVLEQVGTKLDPTTETQTKSDTPETTSDENKELGNGVIVSKPTIVIPASEAAAVTSTVETKKTTPTPVPTIAIPNPSTEIKEEEKPKKKKSKLILILPIILIGIVTLIVFRNDIFGSTKVKKQPTSEKKTGAIITNENGNAYFYPPIDNIIETGTSNDTTYYILGEENSGQKDLYEQLVSLYKKESDNKTFDGLNEKTSEIGPIKENNIWLILPLNYNMLNERIIKSNSKDGSIIVISTEKGITTKISEHLRLMNQLGATKTLIFINNDNDSDDTSSIKAEVKKILKKSGYDEKNTPIIEGKVKEKESVEKLYQNMNNWIDIVKDTKEKNVKAHIINVQRESKETSVIEIELETGTIKKGDKLELIIDDEKQDITVENISVNKEVREKINSQETLENVYLSINKKYSEKLKKASLAVTKGSIEYHNKFKAIFYYEKSQYSQNSENFSSGYTTTIQLQKQITGTITIPSSVKYISKNDTTNLTIILDENAPLFKGQQFTINDPKTGVFGYGQITEIVR